MEKSLSEIKQEIRRKYSGEQIDLTRIKTERAARMVLYLAEWGLNWITLRRLIDSINTQILHGWPESEQKSYWDKFLDSAPNVWFRPGTKRTKTQFSLFDQITGEGQGLSL